VRGEFPLQVAVPWRLDGAAADPEAPLVLALHGQGMLEDSFALLLQPLFGLPGRFLVPRAPWPVDVRSEARIGASWYPYDGDAERFRLELGRTESLLLDLTRAVEARHGLRPRRRYLLGFSQGGYCGAVLALRHPELFDGMIITAARVKTEILGDEIANAGRAGFEVLLCHGARDATVLPEAAEASRDALVAGGVATELELVDAGHTFGRRTVAAIGRWLGPRLESA
jgi:phospholipase/carboxylesterase